MSNTLKKLLYLCNTITKNNMRTLISIFLLLMTGWSATATYGEDGSRLWLRLDTVSTSMITGVKGTAMTELQTYWQGGPVGL